MTTHGFVSAVEHRDDSNLLMIRSRDRESLHSLGNDLNLDQGNVYESLPSDYPFRIIVPKADYAQWCHDRAMGIDYVNFKAEASRHRDSRFMDFLHRVWVAGSSLTDDATRRRNDAAWDERDRRWSQP